MRQEMYSLPEGGEITVEWPERISAESIGDVTAWLELVRGKMERSAVVEPGKATPA